MELKLAICTKSNHSGTTITRKTFREDDLLDWAKKYIKEYYEEYYYDTEVKSVEIESISP